MAFEVEQKFRTDGHAGLAEALAALGASASPRIEQEDRYLSHPCRDFAATGEALRIRSVGDQNAVTYKGPKHGGPTKTREEVEVDFRPGDPAGRDLGRVFEALGFATVEVVRKTRVPYHVVFRGRPVEVVLDEVAGLGTFAEVEAIADSADDLADAQRLVLDLAGELGLTEVEPRSYLRMVLGRRGPG